MMVPKRTSTGPTPALTYVRSPRIPGRTYYGGVYYVPSPVIALERQLARMYVEFTRGER